MLQKLKENFWLYLLIVVMAVFIAMSYWCTSVERQIDIMCSWRDILSKQNNITDKFCDDWIENGEYIEFVNNQKCIVENEECMYMMDERILDWNLEKQYLKDLYINEIK